MSEVSVIPTELSPGLYQITLTKQQLDEYYYALVVLARTRKCSNDSNKRAYERKKAQKAATLSVQESMSFSSTQSIPSAPRKRGRKPIGGGGFVSSVTCSS